MKKKQVTPAVTPKKRGRPRKDAVLTPVNKNPTTKNGWKTRLEAEIKELYGFCDEWRAMCDKKDSEIARIQHLYMDSQAVVRYLEGKLISIIK